MSPRAAVALLAAALLTAQAAPPPAIAPGLWEVTATVTDVALPGALPGVADLMRTAPTVASHCLSSVDAAKGPQELLRQTRADCTIAHAAIADGKLEALLTCAAGTPGAMTVAVKGSYTATSYDAVSHIVMTGGSGMAMTVSATARRTGACSN